MSTTETETRSWPTADDVTRALYDFGKACEAMEMFVNRYGYLVDSNGIQLKPGAAAPRFRDLGVLTRFHELLSTDVVALQFELGRLRDIRESATCLVEDGDDA